MQGAFCKSIMEFLVTHGMDKKVVKSTGNIDEVKQAIRKAFNIMPQMTLKLQKFSQEWGEYIDLEDGEIENKAKLIFISSVVNDLGALLSPISTSSSALSEVPVDLFDLPVSIGSCEAEIQSSVPDTDESQVGLLQTSQDPTQDPTPHPTPDPKPGASSLKEWPTTYSLPENLFPRNLRIALEGKRELSSSQRHKLVNAVFEDMATYTWYVHTALEKYIIHFTLFMRF